MNQGSSERARLFHFKLILASIGFHLPAIACKNVRYCTVREDPPCNLLAFVCKNLLQYCNTVYTLFA